MRTINFIWTSLILVACNGAAPERATGTVAPAAQAARPVAGDAAAGTVRYDRLHRSAFSAKRPVGLCELSRFLDGGAGVYKVVGLSGKTEATQAGTPDGFTYVELELVEAWTQGAPERPVARISGGPAGKGLTRGFAVELAVGETLGVMMYAPRDDNRGFFGIDALGLFQKGEHGGFTNGQLFLDSARELSEIGKLVRENARAEGACPHDIHPSSGVAAPEFRAPTGLATKPVMVRLEEGEPTKAP